MRFLIKLSVDCNEVTTFFENYEYVVLENTHITFSFNITSKLQIYTYRKRTTTIKWWKKMLSNLNTKLLIIKPMNAPLVAVFSRIIMAQCIGFLLYTQRLLSLSLRHPHSLLFSNGRRSTIVFRVGKTTMQGRGNELKSGSIFVWIVLYPQRIADDLFDVILCWFWVPA